VINILLSNCNVSNGKPNRIIYNEKMITNGEFLRIWEAYVVYFKILFSQNITFHSGYLNSMLRIQHKCTIFEARTANHLTTMYSSRIN
jgi:hypothetical protein